MADEQKRVVTPDGNPASESFDTYYDEETKTSWGHPKEAVEDFMCRMRDGVLKCVPPDVTEHLVNSQKELLKAGIALAESGMRRADRTAKRAKDLHEK